MNIPVVDVKTRTTSGPAGCFDHRAFTYDVHQAAKKAVAQQQEWCRRQNVAAKKIHQLNERETQCRTVPDGIRLHLRIPPSEFLYWTRVAGEGFWNDPKLLKAHPEWIMAGKW